MALGIQLISCLAFGADAGCFEAFFFAAVYPVGICAISAFDFEPGREYVHPLVTGKRCTVF
jgi:hypothetical protein